ncbi:MAG: efflux RND transporter periplasmic adaptor subunit [Planctomycetota bacterium]|nr:MAG: efflux RND transporter periplasmic adaptor subunit [Planctomycetota bacterium]
MPETPPDLTRLRIDRSGERRGVRGGWIAAALLLLAGGGYFAWAQFLRPGARAPAVELGRVQRVGGAEAQAGISANGYVVARRQAALSTDIQGRLVELRVEEGDRVREGEVIARLDTTQLDASLARARGDIAQAQAIAEWSQADYDRLSTLVSGGDARQADLDLAQAKLHEAKARVGSLQAAAREVEVMLEKSSIRAPFDGVITRKNAEVGEVVSAVGGIGADARAAIATLVDYDTLEVQVELAQTSLAAAREGAPVLVYLDAFPERGYRGRVRQIWPTADRQKATVELRCEFLERDERILPEMGCRVVFVPEDQAEAKDPEVLVPRRAVVQGPTPRVFLFQNGAVALRSISVAPEESNGMLRVMEGLQGNELVVLDPPASLQDGDAVRRKESGG